MRILIIISSFLFWLASAQSEQTWTIQIASYRDYRLAQRNLDRLLSAGFNAYSEFYMSDNKQFVRTRVGCFYSKEAARSYLENMQSFGQTTAYVAANTHKSDSCFARSIGFITPDKWGIYRFSNERIVFWVSLADLTGFIGHNQTGWQISQTGTELLTQVAQAPMTSYFHQKSEASPVVFNLDDRKPLKLSIGKLLWQSGLTAIILEDDTIVSYQIKGGQ